MIKKIQQYINQNRLFSPCAYVIIGMSGGKDSMAMLDVLTRLGHLCVAAHCNFHLRGEESDRDAEFVKQWCKENNIPFFSTDFDTKKHATDNKISIEMAARELRYSWFEEIREQYNAEAIVVAHHKDDSVETVLLNLVRGTGIKGLSGISPKNGNIVRPFLCITRKEIEDYVEERGLPSVFDSTNDDDAFKRNFLRINVIPQLEKLNPSVKETIYRTSQNMAEAEKMHQSAIWKAIDEITNNFGWNVIDIQALKRTPSPSTVLFEFLSRFDFNPSVIEDIYRSLGTPGKTFFSKKYRLVTSRNKLNISELKATEYGIRSYPIQRGVMAINTPISLSISIKKMPVEIKKDPRFLYADANKLRFPLKLRNWKKGDRFIPFGMSGRKKVSDYFTDRKFDLKQKEDTWILSTANDKIVWIVGERTDNRFRVTEETTNVLVIELASEKVKLS